MLRSTIIALSLSATSLPLPAFAQEHPEGLTEGVEVSRSDVEAPTLSAELSDGGPAISARFGGYVENSFTWSLQDPSNGLIAWRGFDNRHATFNFENVSLNTRFEFDRVYAYIAVQAGRTPDTYYLSEPTDTAGPSYGIGDSSAATYRFIQEAYAGYLAPLLNDVAIEAGLFLSPIGIESITIRNNWNWSQSNLSYALPFYHLGIHLATSVNDDISVHAAVYNGAGKVLDNNDEKSVAAWVGLSFDAFKAQILYYGGVERADGNWLSIFDAWIAALVTPWLRLALQVDGGFEPQDGRSTLDWWVAGAIYGRVFPTDWLAVAIRQDAFLERSPGDDPTRRFFFPTAPLVASTTLTLTFSPEEHVGLYLEYRHDQTASSMDLGGSALTQYTYFEGDVATDPMTGEYVPNSATQDTITLGHTAGF
jgi:hypothetical protein